MLLQDYRNYKNLFENGFKFLGEEYGWKNRMC